VAACGGAIVIGDLRSAATLCGSPRSGMCLARGSDLWSRSRSRRREAPSLAVPCLWTGLLLRTAACPSGVTNASPTRQSFDGPTFQWPTSSAAQQPGTSGEV